MGQYDLPYTGPQVEALLAKISELESEMPSKTSDLTNDSGFITSEDVPTKTSDLNNDSGFITNAPVAAEAARAQAAEALLATISSLQAEITRATGVEGTLQDLIDGIAAKIPSAATAQNQLADKAFVNSSIATATATFRGTYNSLAELQAVSADENDYGYVRITDAAGNTIFKRYKYASGSWVFEYDLNNSSFTASQWAAINSAITAELVEKLRALPTSAAVTELLNGKQGVIPDLDTIRANAAAGGTAYQKPAGGIPKTDLESGVQTSLGKADSAVQESAIADNLTTDDAKKVLSAKQGVALAGQISQLGQEVAEQTEGVDLVVNTPKIINLSGGVGTIAPAPSNLAGWGYYEAECGEGSKITLSGNGGNYGLWGFVDASGYILSWSGTNVSGTNKEIIAPAGTARVIVNTYNPGNYPAPKLISSTSLVGKINNLDSEVSETNKKLGQLLTEKSVSPTRETGKYITMSGTIASASGYEYDSFDAEAGDIIKVAFTFSSGNLAAISVANSDLSVITPQIQAINGTHEYQYLCKEDGKIVISGVSSSLTYEVIHSRIDEQIQESGLPIAIKRIFPAFTINDGQYWNKSGQVANLGGWIRSSGAYLKKGSVVTLYWDGLNNPYISIITEVTSQGGFIRSCVLTPNPNVAGELSYCIDKDGYYSISNSKAAFYQYSIIEFANGNLFFNPPLDKLFLPTQDGLPREILRTPSFVGIVHKWGFIGDSLSSGEQAVKKDGTSTLERFDLYDYSWGQRLCKLNSVEGFNFSVGGQTAKGWCSGIDERTWAGAQLQENWKEAYCIALGVNDRSAPYPKGDADTDINLSDYTQNADTFAGWYAGIIQRLRSVNPKCRIFCITIPYNNQQGYLDNNEVIRAIVPKFNRCYLVDLANYHWTPSGLGLNDHLSPAGYQWAAFEINTYIDWIIRNNMDDFKDIAWVGTEYSA